jgi:putative acetyltransferase
MQQLYVDTIQSVCRQDYTQEQINVWISSVENTARWLNIINNQWVLLAKINNHLLGYGTLKDSHYIDLFYVHKEFLRQGIAGKLLEQLESQALKSQTEWLTADVSITAKPFFERNGFRVIAEQKNIIKKVELINFKMGKRLKE